MGRRVLDLSGERYGIMTVIERDKTVIGGHGISSKWIVQCDCGNIRTIKSSVLRCNKQISCGCLRGIGGRFQSKYGIPKSAFQRWVNMMRRCYSPTSDKDKKNYMDRGITVSDEWHNPINFYKDMGEPPFDGASIDRRDNNAGYSKENCRWATWSEQNLNRRPMKRGGYH